jgi:hypothetical protein
MITSLYLANAGIPLFSQSVFYQICLLIPIIAIAPLNKSSRTKSSTTHGKLGKVMRRTPLHEQLDLFKDFSVILDLGDKF